MLSRRTLLKSIAAAAPAAVVPNALLSQGASPHHIAPGPFQPTWDSLKAGYQTPDWFRDAKFGIWSCWGPESMPEQGDWYTRNLYLQGSAQNKFHVANYGHPSKFGAVELIGTGRGEVLCRARPAP
jgi:alpha-L-fucosidase